MSWFDTLYQGTQTIGQDGKTSGRGFSAFVLNPFVDEDKLNADSQRQTNQQIATRNNYELSELGIDPTASTYDVEGAIVGQRKEDAETKAERDFQRSLAPLKAQTKQQADQFNAQITLQENRLNADAAERNDQRAEDMSLRRMQMEKEDRRYNERLDREEKNRRQESIMALTQGLAALGAAFAM